MERGTATKTVHFELDIIGGDEDRRCYRCHTRTSPMFVVRPPRSSIGQVRLFGPRRPGGRRMGPDGMEVKCMTLYAERLLPHNIEAEEAVLGSILIDPDCIIRLTPIIKAGDFYRERNRLCFAGAVALFQRGQAVDQLTLAGELATHRKAGRRGRHGLPLPPGLHHPHLGALRGIRGDHLPHLNHAQAH